MATGALTEATGEVIETVADNLEGAAEATRLLEPRVVSFFLGGVGVGVVVGFFFGYRYNREKLRAEAFQQSEEELDDIRKVYQQRIVASQTKPSAEEIIEERGYSVHERPLAPPVPVAEPPQVVFTDQNIQANAGWDYKKEIAARDTDTPYVIHQDEFNSGETGYDKTEYTYYANDDVLVDTDNIPLPHADIIVGQSNLKFGHGTDDENVVYVRNDRIAVEMEITRVPKSYEEEILGLEHSHSPTRPAQRKRR
jgi:hypothetical protein